MTAPALPARAHVTEPLLRKGFLAWLAAAVVSETGDGILYFALAWTASGLGPGIATLVLVFGLLPEVLLTLVGGVAADRWGVRRTVIGCTVAMCAVLGVALVAHRLSTPLVVLLVAVSLAQGLVSAFHRPANGVFPRLFLPAASLSRGMAVTGSVLQVARLAGPPVGALVVVALTFAGAMLLDLLSFLAVLAVLLVVRPPSEPGVEADRGGTDTTWQQLRGGLAAIREVPGVLAMLAAVALLAGSILPLLTLGVPLLARNRGWAATDAGAIEACWIVGSLVVSMVVARRGTRARPLGPMVTGPALAAGGILAMALAPAPLLAAVAAVLMGVGTSVFTSHVFPLYVLRSPERMLARFQSVLVAAQMVAMLVGNAAVGAAVGWWGAGPAIAIAGLGCLLAAVPVLSSRVLRSTTTEAAREVHSSASG